VVEMRDAQAPAMFPRQANEHFEQRHRVHAARYGDQDGLPGLKKMPLLDGDFDALNQITHGVMLGGSPPLTSGIGRRRMARCRKENASRRKRPGRVTLTLELHELESGSDARRLQT
jgi:hypothetical protein